LIQNEQISNSPLIPPIKGGVIIYEYKFITVLGQGGFGTSYLCEDLNLKRKCIIKEYTPYSLASRRINGELTTKSLKFESMFNEGLKEFLKEAQNIALFNHANIVRINRFFEKNNTGYFIMDYEEGESLRDIILRRKTKFKEYEIEEIIIPLCKGLGELHKRNLIPRDIKPENIIIRRDGSPILIDFGAIGNLNSIKNEDYKIYLTPHYATIEQYSSNLPQGPWIDIYALGATLYELISGFKPQNSIERINNDKIIPIFEIGRGEYGTKLLSLIDKSLLLNFNLRPHSIDELLNFLEHDKYLQLRRIVESTTIKAITHFLNFASPNQGLIVDEFVTFLVGFSILDLTWRLNKGNLINDELFEKLLDYNKLEYYVKEFIDLGFVNLKRNLNLIMIKARLEEYAATYLLDRQEENWTYALTRKQCAKNCIEVKYQSDVDGFINLLEDVIDRYRGRLKKEIDKVYYNV
jgi:serine/threonine protein kinase